MSETMIVAPAIGETAAQMSATKAAESVESRLLASVAGVLGLVKDEIQLYDSFVDLGGDQRSAMALRRACMKKGMTVRTRDILGCRTLAELETCIVPSSPRKLGYSPSVASVMIAPPEIQKARRLSIVPNDGAAHSRHSSSSSSASNGQHGSVEGIIASCPAMSRAVIIRPKAGLLDGKLVALVTLASKAIEVETPRIQLIPRSQMLFAATQIAGIRQTLETTMPAESMPDKWIVLEGMPMTETGLVDRRRLRTWCQNMNEQTLHQATSVSIQEAMEPPSTDMEKTLQRLVAQVLHISAEQVGVNFTFAHFGGDDMAAAELEAQCRHESISLKASDIQISTIRQLAAAASQRAGIFHTWSDDGQQSFELSPMQQLYFRTTMGGDMERRAAKDGCYRFNQSLLFKVKRNFSIEDISAAIEAMVGHHSMLRARFNPGQGRWTQRILPDVGSSYSLNHSTVTSEAEVQAIIAQTQTTIDIENGPIFAAEHIMGDEGQHMLYLVAHHLVVDLLSWRIIVHDLDELLENGSLLSRRSMPFQKWNELQKTEVSKLDVKTLMPFDVPFGDYAYWGLHGAPNTYGDALEASFSLSPELTSILQMECNEILNTDTVDIFLAALLLSFSQTFPDRRVPAVWTQEHGRETPNDDIDISETVGWFTSICPLAHEVVGSDDFIEILRRIKDVRRSIPSRGSEYFASKFFNANAPDLFAREWPLEIIFSYAGSIQQLERVNGSLEQLTIPCADLGPKVGRIALFEISAMISQGQAEIRFLYNRLSKHQDSISAWIHNYEHLLLEAIGRLRYHPQELTLADVPHMKLSYHELARLNRERVTQLGLSSPRNIEDVFPITAIQQSVLLSQARTPEDCHFHAIYEFTTPTGDPVDTTRICSAWQHVNNRHAALRTVFIESVTERGLYDQVVLKKCSPNMLFIDISPHDDPVEELNHLPPFKCLPTLPRHRLTVCKAPTRTFVKLDISETLCDASSVHILFGDLRRAYATERAIPSTATFSYPDYLASVEANRQKSLAHCVETTRGVQPCLFPRLNFLPDGQSQRPQNAYFELDVSMKDLFSFADRHNLSTGTVLRVAWGLVLRAVLGRDDVCFGFWTVGRNASVEAFSNIVGCFAHAVPCVMGLSQYKTLAASLRAAEEQYNGIVSNQHTTLAEIHHALGMKGGDRLFNTCLSFVTESSDLNSRFTTRTNFELKSLSLWESSEYDVAINARGTTQSKIAIDIGFRVMSQTQALNICHTFGQAIQAIINSPNGSVGGALLFSDRDYAQIINENDGESSVLAEPQSVSVTLPEVIFQQSVERPDAPAVCGWDGEFTYLQLEQHATRLAHFLISYGIGPAAIVPVILEKTKWSIVILLAVLKAGAAFVPIDADELSHVKAVFARLGSTIAIATKPVDNTVVSVPEQLLVLSDSLLSGLPEPDRLLPSALSPTGLACVFFIPTSSKEARSIAFNHSTLAATFMAQGPAARISSQSRVMQLSSFTVDISLSEIFTTLVHGGCICIPSSKERLHDFTTAAERMKVTWSYMTPLLSRKLDPQLLPSLKAVCFRTRSLDEDTYSAWVGKANVILAYGAPDVCPLGISFLEVVGPHQLNCIARPFTGSFWIINPDDHRRLMPIGGVGELVIEGPTLGMDYPPTLESSTDAAPEPDTAIKTRYFKTGHQVRYTEDGLLEFISSKRDDLEIGGKTIVISEVEQHVRRALGQGIDVMVETIAFRDARDVPVLAAFIELGKLFEGPEDLTKLSKDTKERVHIAQKLVENGLHNVLPPHKIPSIFIPVKHLPITPSLKVNRRRLQKMIHGLSREQLTAAGAVTNPSDVKNIGLKPLPLTQAEERMRSLWAGVLGVSQQLIGVGDSFFRAGGDEYLAAELVVACRHAGVALSIAGVLNNQTLTEMCRTFAVAEDVEQSRSPDPSTTSTTSSPSPRQQTLAKIVSQDVIDRILAPRVGVKRENIKDVAEASSVQIRYVEGSMLRGRANIDYFVFNFTGALNWNRLKEACQVLATIHPILRTAFVPHNRKVYQVVLKSFTAEFKRIACPSFRMASINEKIIRKDQAGSVAFCAPMTKFVYLDAGKQSTLIMRLSKAQYDNMSIALLVKDLKRLYDGMENPPRRPTYCDFVRHAQAEQGAEEYWRNLLDGASMTQICSHSKPYGVTKTTKTVRNRLTVGPLSNLGITFETLLKAAWAIVLARMSASTDVVFGEVIDGRHIRLPHGQSVSGVLGPTTNTIPVRVCFPETQLTPLSLLQYVHGQRLASIPFENIGHHAIVEKCTSWPYWTRFSSVVLHQHEDFILTPQEPKTFHLGPATCKLTVVHPKAQDISDLLVHSTTRGDAKMEIGLTFCQERVPSSFADTALEMLCSTIHLLNTVSVMQPALPSAAEFRASPRLIPLAPPASSPAAAATSMLSPASSLQAHHAAQQLSGHLSAEQSAAIQTCISRAWTAVLDPRGLGVPDDSLQNTAFYNLWGSLVPAAQLAADLNRELPKLGIAGLDGTAASKIGMEDIIEYPTMLRQFELVAKKTRDGNKRLGGGPGSPLKQRAQAVLAAIEKDKKRTGLSPRKTDPGPAPSERPTAGVLVPVTVVDQTESALFADDADDDAPGTRMLRVSTYAAPAASRPVSRAHSHVRNRSAPFTSVSAGAASLGKSIRRFASTVAQQGPSRNPAQLPHNAAAISPATPHAGPLTAPAVVSPLTPRVGGYTPVSLEPPRLPMLPVFTPVDEVAEEAAFSFIPGGQEELLVAAAAAAASAPNAANVPTTVASHVRSRSRSASASGSDAAVSLTDGSSAAGSSRSGDEDAVPAPLRVRGESITTAPAVDELVVLRDVAVDEPGANPIYRLRHAQAELQKTLHVQTEPEPATPEPATPVRPAEPSYDGAGYGDQELGGGMAMMRASAVDEWDGFGVISPLSPGSVQYFESPLGQQELNKVSPVESAEGNGTRRWKKPGLGKNGWVVFGDMNGAMI